MSQPASPANGDRDTSILIVDDDHRILRALARHMHRAGLRTETTQSPHEALSLVERNHYDIILSDVHMPQMSGVEFLQRVTSANEDQLFFMMSGFATLEELQHDLHIDDWQFFEKPLCIRSLLQQVCRFRGAACTGEPEATAAVA